MNRTNLTHRNSQVNAGGTLSITSGNDTTIRGANVSGKDVDVNVGNNLIIASEQNTGDVKGHKYDASFSLTIGAGVSGSVSGGYGETEGSSAWTGNQTSLTGSNSINVKVKNHTQLDGAVLGNIKENGTDGNNFNLTTKTFGFSDLKDHDKEKSSYVGLTVGFGSSKNSSGERQTSGSIGIDAQYSSHNKQQNTFATLGNGNITIQSDIDNGTNSLAGINRDVTESQIITKDKSRNYDVYVNSETISTLTDDSKRAQLVDRITSPGRIVGEAFQFGEIIDSVDNAVATMKHGEIKAPTDDQLQGLSQEQQNVLWADYYDKKENQGVIKTSSMQNFDGKVYDFSIAAQDTLLSRNHDGQIKDGVDVLNNATTYGVDTNQFAMQLFVDGMSQTTDFDALLFSKATSAGLPKDAKGVAVVNKENGTNIVGVNIDNTNLKNHSDFITTIAEETYHNMNPGDHQANLFADHSARLWNDANVKEGRTTGQGVGIKQWREDNKNHSTINENNKRIGSQRVADMEFRGLDSKVELPLIRDTSAAFAKYVRDTTGREITPEDAEQQLVEQALKRADSEFAHLSNNAIADEWLNAMSKGIIKDENGEHTVKMYTSNKEQYHSDHETAQKQHEEVSSKDHVLVFDPYNSEFVLNGQDPLKAAEALSRVIIGSKAFENNAYGENDVVFGMDYGIFSKEFITATPVAYGKPRIFKNGVFDPIDLNNLVSDGYISGDTETLADRLGFMGYSQWELANNDNPKQAVFLESIRYLSNDSSTPMLVMSDFEENFNNRFGSTKHALGNYLTTLEQGQIQAGLDGLQRGDMLNLSPYLKESADRAVANNGNFVTGFKEYVVNEANKTTFLEDPSANTSQFTVGYVEKFGRSFETTFDTNAPAFLQVNATGDAFWNAVDVATIFIPGRMAGKAKAADTDDFRTAEMNLDSVYNAVPEGNYSKLDDPSLTYRTPDGRLRADIDHTQPTGSFVREPGKNPTNASYQIHTTETATETNQNMINIGYTPAWREGGTVETGILLPGEKIYMIVDKNALLDLQIAAQNNQPLKGLGRWSSENALPDRVQPARDVTAVKKEWKDDAKTDLYVIELEVKQGSSGVITKRGENGPVFDNDLNRDLNGGVIQHELFDRSSASDNLQLNNARKLNR